ALVKAAAKPKPLIDPEVFAQRLRTWRKGHRLAQWQAGRALGVSQHAVWSWEHGFTMPWPAQLRAVLAKLDAPPVGVTGINGWLMRSARLRDPGATFAKKLRACTTVTS